MVTEFVAYSLLSNYANSTQIKGFVDKYDYYIFPVVNPDGKGSLLPSLPSLATDAPRIRFFSNLDPSLA